MDKYIYNENNGLWYEWCGDYYLPYLVLPEQKSVGKWGQKYRVYLRKHKREEPQAVGLGCFHNRVDRRAGIGETA